MTQVQFLAVVISRFRAAFLLTSASGDISLLLLLDFKAKRNYVPYDWLSYYRYRVCIELIIVIYLRLLDYQSEWHYSKTGEYMYVRIYITYRYIRWYIIESSERRWDSEVENKNWANPPKDSRISSNPETLAQQQRETRSNGRVSCSPNHTTNNRKDKAWQQKHS